jgi:hypothetical protein
MNATFKKVMLIILAVVAVFLVIWGISLIKCEILTSKYHDDFEHAYTSNPMLGEMEYFKVLSCDGENAKVYYVSKDMADANVLYFNKLNGVWSETGWNTVWSSTGSASDVIFPYWWHFIYGGL